MPSTQAIRYSIATPAALRRAALVAMALLLGHQAWAADPPELPSITWLHSATRSGDIDPHGAAEIDEDAVLHWVMDRLPGYRQTIMVADIARMTELFKSRDGICFPMLLKTEDRLRFIEFSDRLFWALPARVIVVDGASARFDRLAAADGTLALDRLLDDTSLTGAYEIGRPFAPAVNETLTRYRHTGRLVEATEGANMYAMLATGRVDWVIGHLSETRHLLGEEYPAIRFHSYGIAGNASPLAGFVGCSKGPQGLQIVAEIDRALRRERRKDPAQEVYDRWLDPADRAALHSAFEAVERREGE